MNYTFVYTDNSKLTESFKTIQDAARFAQGDTDHLIGWYSHDMSFEIAQLRHLYNHLINGTFIDSAELADGLLHPVIEELELRNL